MVPRGGRLDSLRESTNRPGDAYLIVAVVTLLIPLGWFGVGESIDVDGAFPAVGDESDVNVGALAFGDRDIYYLGGPDGWCLVNREK
jgi:hypothetical protein